MVAYLLNIVKLVKNFLKKYWAVVIGVIVVAVFTGLPSFLFFQRVGNDFAGVYPVNNGDTLFYLARTQEVFDGHKAINHQYFWEHKNSTYAQARGAEYFFGFIADIFHISLPALQIIMDFVSPAIIFILTYLLLYTIAPHKYAAVILPLLTFTLAFGGITKPMHPQLSLPILIIFLIFWVRFIKNNQDKRFNAVLAGAFFGLLFLTYHYHWMFAITLTGIYFLILLLRQDWLNTKYYLLMWGVAVAAGIPYLLQFISGAKVPYYAEMLVRIGLYHSHLPETYPRLAVALVWLAFFIFFARYYKLEEKPAAQIIASLLIANVLFPNHQLITGIIVENANHWAWMPLFIFIISGHYIFWVISRQQEQERKRAIIKKIMLAILFILIIAPAYRFSTFTLQPFLQLYADRSSAGFRPASPIDTKNLQYYSTIFDWINENTEPDAVIFSDSRLMSFIPVYTRANVYNTEYAQWLPGSDQEIIERSLLTKFFDEDAYVNGEFQVEKFYNLIWAMTRQTEENTHTILDNYGLSWRLRYEPKYSISQEKEKIQAVYANLKIFGWDINLLKKYRLDYIIWDKNFKPEWKLDEYQQLSKVYEDNNVAIYTLAR
ncbi:MAG: hypothetical protein Q8Q23_04850 [bacterium]|nr:hypothetical protein [bacterium]